MVTSCDVYRAFGRLWRTEPGPPDRVPLTEESPLRANRAGDLGDGIDYDNIEIEHALSSSRELPVTILRLPAIHGVGDPQHRLFGYLKRMDDKRPILLEESFARWHWSRGYVENVASAIALAVHDDRALQRVYNVAEPIAYSEAEWVRRIGEVVGWQGEVVPVPAALLPQSEGVDLDFSQQYIVDSSRIRRELGYTESVTEDQALQRTIEWERLNPPTSGFPRPEYQIEDATLAALRRTHASGSVITDG